MADISPFPFATAGELRSRWPDMPLGSDPHAEVLIEDASQFILDVCPTAVDVSAATRRRIVCAVVRRSMEAALPPGMSQSSETVGPFSHSFTASNPSGDFYLTKAEKLALGEGRQTAFSVGVSGSFVGFHRPWCNIYFGNENCSCGAALTGGEPLWEA